MVNSAYQRSITIKKTVIQKVIRIIKKITITVSIMADWD